ncbi:MAG: plastocyanin/azurin family copper-binding protein [Gemmatimonadales bacterium]
MTVACGLLLCAASLARAQGAVSGRVGIVERPGETTSDFTNAVIYLVPKSGAARTAETKAQMALNGRQFSPRVRVVTTGSSVEYPNQDPFSHNVFSTAAGASFDLGVYGSGTTKATQFRKPGAYPVYCNIHEKMTAYVVVVNTPYYAQAAADGRWSVARVPAGKYELHLWHERAIEVVKEVDVPPSGLPDVDQKLDATGYKQVAHKDKFGKDYVVGATRY